MDDITLSVANALIEARKAAHLTQQAVADRAGTAQALIARNESGSINVTLNTLSRHAAALGCAVRITLVPLEKQDAVVDAYKRDVDRTLLRDNLRKTVSERIRTLGEWQQNSRELQRAMREARQRR